MDPKRWEVLTLNESLVNFVAELPAIISGAGYDEMYGVTLRSSSEGIPAPRSTLIILQKFLRANTDDLERAKTQLSEALKWRKEYKPLDAKNEIFDADKFGGLAFVTTLKAVKATVNDEAVATFNIYGEAAKDANKTFGDPDKFVRWRVAHMEITLAQLKLQDATLAVPAYGQGPDPYQAIQVHDYLSVSFFRPPAEIKNSSTKIIDLFQRYYPETVSYKYFVNILLIMQWMMGAMKALMSKDSIQKMTWLTYGNILHTYIGDDLPEEYGGSGAPLKEKALTPRYGNIGTASKSESVEGSDSRQNGTALTAPTESK